MDHRPSDGTIVGLCFFSETVKLTDGQDARRPTAYFLLLQDIQHDEQLEKAFSHQQTHTRSGQNSDSKQEQFALDGVTLIRTECFARTSFVREALGSNNQRPPFSRQRPAVSPGAVAAAFFDQKLSMISFNSWHENIVTGSGGSKDDFIQTKLKTATCWATASIEQWRAIHGGKIVNRWWDEFSESKKYDNGCWEFLSWSISS